MYNVDLEKAEKPEIKLSTSVKSLKKEDNSRKTFTPASLAMPNPLPVWTTTNCKILKEVGIPDHLTRLLRNLYAGQEATVNWTWNNRLVPNRKRSTSRLYIVTLLV